MKHVDAEVEGKVIVPVSQYRYFKEIEIDNFLVKHFKKTSTAFYIFITKAIRDSSC